MTHDAARTDMRRELVLDVSPLRAFAVALVFGLLPAVGALGAVLVRACA